MFKSPREIVKELLLDHKGSDNPISLREIGEELDKEEVESFVDTARNHFHKMAQIAYVELGYVLSNDDIPHHLRHFQIETGCVSDLYRNLIVNDGIVFLGQEGSVGESTMSYIQYSNEKIQAYLLEIYNEDQDSSAVPVSHTPPYGSLDYKLIANGDRNAVENI